VIFVWKKQIQLIISSPALKNKQILLVNYNTNSRPLLQKKSSVIFRKCWS
jgi:hypothetical protein